MGTNLSGTRLGKIEWFETRAPVWQNDPVGIGITVELAADVFGFDDTGSDRVPGSARCQGGREDGDIILL